MSEEARSGKEEAARMVERMRAGDVRALARVISVVEDGGPGAAELLAICRGYSGSALRVGVTGPPGAGKSTLVDQIVRWLRDQDQTVGVLAVDPSSPYTGGALLGDRIRMQGFAADAGVSIRSMASRGAMGGVAAAAANVCSVMEAAGNDAVLIETVGVGQDEVEVARLADVTVLVLVPGMGDEVQSLKAGVMEIADIFVVNKCDREGGERVEAEVLAMQALGKRHGGWVAPVVRTVATTGKGVEELMAAVRRCAEEKRRSGPARWVQKMGSATGPVGDPRMDHLGIAVRSIAVARRFYEAMGLVVSHEETVEHEQVRTAMLPMGESRIELLEPTEEDSTVGRFLAKRGEGLHHLAVRVDGVDAMFARMGAEGVRLASDAVRTGAGGHRYFFVHPASTGGVLLEIVGNLEGGGVKRLLLIDTCGSEGVVGLAEVDSEARVVAIAKLPGRSASERLVPEVKGLLARRGWKLKELKAIVVDRGPGSFTGVRVGLSAAKGLSEASGVPLVGVSRLDMLASLATRGEERVWAVLDAGRGEFYGGEYIAGKCLREALFTAEELRASLQAARAVVCDHKVANALHAIGPVLVEEPSVESLLRLALERIKGGDFDNAVWLDANYLRRMEQEILVRMDAAGSAG